MKVKSFFLFRTLKIFYSLW